MEKKVKIRFIVALKLLPLLFCTSCDSCGVFDFGALISPYGGCEEDKHWDIIPAGLATNVSGQFYDFNKNSPIINAKVFIEEYGVGPSNYLVFSRYIDSTQTDHAGNFKLPFTTTGSGVQYQLYVVPAGVNWWYPTSRLVIENIGADNVLNCSSSKLSILEAKIKVVDNPYTQPLITTSEYNNYSSRVFGDSIVFYRVLPNRKNRIFFYTNSDTRLNYYDRGQVDTINLEGDFRDTIKVELELDGKKFAILN